MRAIKQGQHFFIAFKNGEAVLDSQLRPQMYKSLEQFKKSFPGWREEGAELMEYAPLTPHEPLTPDELQEMEGRPVYLETGEVIIKEQIIGCWEIVCRITRYDDDTVFWFTRRVRGFWASDYGKTWLAYRRPPEGEKTDDEM